MSDVPEKIWATGNKTTGSWNHTPLSLRIAPVQTEYTRTDIAQARIDELEEALYKVLVARTYDTVFDETEIWELEHIAREALKDTTNE